MINKAMLTMKQESTFIGFVVNCELLEKAIEWIGVYLTPGDVFGVDDLEQWALKHGFERKP